MNVQPLGGGVTRRIPRRKLVQQTAACALLGGLALGACGTRTRSPHPTAQAPVVTVTFQPFFISLSGSLLSSAQKLATEALGQFAQEGGSKGIRIQMALFQSTDTNIAAMTSGSGPDVVYDYSYAPYVEQKLIAPLDDFVKQDGLDLATWSAGQIAVYQRSGHLYAVPAYMGTACYAVNVSAFDQAGQPYPTADWTSDDFVKVCTEMTATVNGQTRYGGMLYQWDNMIDGSRWIFNAFGGSLMSTDGTTSTLSTPGSLAAGQWMFEKCYWPRICVTRSSGYWGMFGSGQLAMRTMGTWELFGSLQSYQNMKWTLLPFPIFPAGRATFSTDDFWALNARSKHPREAWEVMKWASAGTYWNTFNMKMQLLSPARVDLWDQWIYVVEAAAPPLKGKGLQWYADAAQKGYALAPLYYKYNDPQAEDAVGGVINALYTKSLDSVTQGFATADNLVDAIEAAGAQAAVSSSASSSKSSATSASASG